MLAGLQCSPAGPAEELERGSLLQIDCAAPGPAPPTSAPVTGPVDAQAPPPAAPPRPPADPACVHHVDLSFSKLTAVPPLAHYANLRALQLNNNSLTTLQGLGGLASLGRLDLSFNSIARLDRGVLAGLPRLEDLSLYSNRLASIDGLAQLTGLKALSLGKNLLCSMEALRPLRPLRRLRCLTVEGNPLCRGGEAAPARAWLCAHLPGVLFLDHRRVGPEETAAARELHAMELLGLEEQEERITAQQQEGSDVQARAARLEAAGLEAVAAFLLDGSMGASKEWAVLRALPALLDAWPQHLEQLQAALDECQARIAQQRARAAKALHDHRQDSRAMVEGLEAEARELTREVEGLIKGVRKAARVCAGGEAQGGAAAALARMEEVKGQLEDVARDGAQCAWEQLGELQALVEEQAEAACGTFAALFDALERGLADFWQGVAAAAPQVHARLQRASTVCEGLAAEVQGAIADKDCLASCVAEAHRARRAQLASLRQEVESRERDRAAALVAVERSRVEAEVAARAAEVAAWAAAAQAELGRLAQLEQWAGEEEGVTGEAAPCGEGRWHLSGAP